MLPRRSPVLKVLLLLTVTTITSGQDYEGSYDVESESGGEAEDSGHPDYSKYYSVDTSAPLVASQGNPEGGGGFTSPIEFSGFFSPIEFGASGKQEVKQNPFVGAPQANRATGGFAPQASEFQAFYSGDNFPKDYFEEAQARQANKEQAEGETRNVAISPGPNYISHQLPGTYALEGEYSGEAEAVEPITKSPRTKSTNSKNKKKKYEDDYSVEAEAKDYTGDYSVPKYTDYNVGKSSSSVSQHPRAQGVAGSTPYQKYSFQPVTEGFQSKYLGSLISTVAPFNPAYSKIASTEATPLFETQSSEQVPSHLKGKNCRRVKKSLEGDHERSKREALDCYVCEDPNSSAKFSECSYNHEPEPTKHFAATSERFSTPAHPSSDGFRYKRYSGDEYNADPYEYVRKQSRKAYKESEDSQKDDSKDFEDFKYVPDYYTDTTGDDKSYSETQSAEIAKNPKNCKKELRNGMTCSVCTDPKTGGNYEQCSYAIDPKEKKYAYVTEKKYDSNDEEPEEKVSESKPEANTEEEEESEKAKNARLAKERHDNYDPKAEFYNRKPEPEEEESHPPKRSSKYRAPSPEEYHYQAAAANTKKSKKFIEDDPYEVPKHFAEHTIDDQKKPKDEEEESVEESKNTEKEEVEDQGDPKDAYLYKDLDEYHLKLFPEFSNEESTQTEVVAGSNPSSETTRKDVEEVLAEFSKKDRSSCKKAEKKGMTCYLCVDAKGIQHEECMYVSESKPKATHVAYHEVKQIKDPKELPPPPTREQSVEPTEVKKQRKRFFKKVTTTATPFTLESASSEEVESRVRFEPKKRRNARDERIQRDKQEKEEADVYAFDPDSDRLKEEEDEPTQKTPVEFQVGDEEGAFAAETKPVYSKTLGVSLPRYMVDKSEFEKEFDEFAGRF